MTILIGVPAFRRPESLRRLLESFEAHLPVAGVEVMVVDNDPDQSSHDVVQEVRCRGHLTVHYETERAPGVVHVRNRLLAAAEGYEALIFVDDDEWIPAAWFPALMDASRRHPQAVIAGPVRYELPPNMSPEMRDGGFFNRPEHPDGVLLNATGTGNSLLPLNVVTWALANPFDPEFARIGGEDTDFFLRMTSAGFEIRWAEDATLHEDVDPADANLAGAMRRYRRAGLVNAKIALRSQSRPIVLAGALARLAVGGARLAKRRMTRKPLRAADVATFGSGKGYLAGALGRSMKAYGQDLA